MSGHRPRLAIYFTPDTETPLASFGRQWLGRDIRTSEPIEQPKLAGFDRERLAAITAVPRHYGFHATLKAPFALAPGLSREDVHDAAARFAAQRSVFEAPPLTLRALAGFLALAPSAPCPHLDALASDCVEHFDRFRAPLTAAERARWLEMPLTPRQRILREIWGYPYVMEEFQFHMTLTNRLEEGERREVMQQLSPLVAPFCLEPLRIDAICVFEQETREAPFRLTGRYPFL